MCYENATKHFRGNGAHVIQSKGLARATTKEIARPQRIYERVTAYIEAEQRLGRIANSLDAFSVAALLLGPCHQYAYLRYFMGMDPFPVTNAQCVVDIILKFRQK
jgi:hypothetical protein